MFLGTQEMGFRRPIHILPSVSKEYHQRKWIFPKRKEHLKGVGGPSHLPTRSPRVFAASAAQGSKPLSRAMIGS